jgi:thiamine-phosphate pyrophosphorylase
MPSTRELPRPVLMLVTDATRLAGRDMKTLLRDAIDGGVNVVQVRGAKAEAPPADQPKKRGMFGFLRGDAAGADSDLVELADAASDVTYRRASFIVNSDSEVARLSHANGLHLPEADARMAASERRQLGPERWVSRSVHSIDAARRAESEGANFVVLGTVFATQSHPDALTIGVEGVRAVCEAVSIPVLAIGGITADNAHHVIEAGATGIAVIGAIFDAADARAAAAALRAAIASIHA